MAAQMVTGGTLEDFVRDLAAARSSEATGGEQVDLADTRRRVEEWVRRTYPEAAEDILRALSEVESDSGGGGGGGGGMSEAAMDRLAVDTDAATRTPRSASSASVYALGERTSLLSTVGLGPPTVLLSPTPRRKGWILKPPCFSDPTFESRPHT
jgi:hypothetical protein